MEVVHSSGFNLAVSSPRDRRGREERICIVAIKDKTMGFIHLIEFTLSTSCHLV